MRNVRKRVGSKGARGRGKKRRKTRKKGNVLRNKISATAQVERKTQKKKGKWKGGGGGKIGSKAQQQTTGKKEAEFLVPP